MVKIETMITLVLAFLILLGCIIYALGTVEDIEATLEKCKERGYEGIEFHSPFSNKVVCWNVSQLEKDMNEIEREIKDD